MSHPLFLAATGGLPFVRAGLYMPFVKMIGFAVFPPTAVACARVGVRSVVLMPNTTAIAAPAAVKRLGASGIGGHAKRAATAIPAIAAPFAFEPAVRRP